MQYEVKRGASYRVSEAQTDREGSELLVKTIQEWPNIIRLNQEFKDGSVILYSYGASGKTDCAYHVDGRVGSR